MYLAAFSSSIAIVAAVSETLQNFSKRAGYLYIVLMIIHFLLCFTFEETIRDGLFPTIRTHFYYPGVGVAAAIVYIVSCVISLLTKVDEVFRRINITEDILGLLVLILIASILTILNYVYFLELNYWGTYFIFYVACLLLNFIIAFLIIYVSVQK